MSGDAAARSEGARSALMWFLCAPSILGTLSLWVVAVARSGDSHLARRAIGALEIASPWLFIMAAYGPLLVCAAAIATLVRRGGEGRSPAMAGTVLPLVLGTIASVLFYGLLIDVVTLP